MKKMKTFDDIVKLNMEAKKIKESENLSKEPAKIKKEEVKDEPKVVERRINAIDKRLKELMSVVNGEKESFLPFVEDENGRLSSQKIEKFIAELIDSHPDAKELSSMKRKILEIFFFCVISGPSGLKSEVSMEVFVPHYIIASTFEEFIRAAEDPIFQEKDRMKLVRDEEHDRAYTEYGFGFSFFQNLWLDKASERLFYTDEELREAAEEYADIRMEDPEDVWNKWKGIQPTTEETDSIMEDSDKNKEESDPVAFVKIHLASELDKASDDYEGYDLCEKDNSVEDCEIPLGYDMGDDNPIECFEPDWEAIQRVEEACLNMCNNAYDRFVNHLPENENLQYKYIQLRKNLHMVDYSDFADLTRVMVSNFILKHQISPLCYQSRFDKINEKLFESIDEIYSIGRGDEN